MDGLFDALANAELSLFGILAEPNSSNRAYGNVAADTLREAEEPVFDFDLEHYRQAAG